MKRTLTRTLSLLLALLTLTYAFPLSVFATDTPNVETQTNADDSTATTVDTQEPITLQKQGISEMVERREESAKHFRLADGSYALVSYETPVHYLDSTGTWQDIDNRLAEDSSNYVTGDARIKFAKKVTGNEELFTLQESNRKVTFSLEGARKKTVGQVRNPESVTEDGFSELQKKTTLHNLSSEILYEDILDGVDLEYLLHAHTVKENIIVKEKKESYRYTFNLQLNGLTATLREDGSVLLQDEKNGESVYVMPAPVVFDAAGTDAPAEAAAFTLTALGGKKYALAVTVDEAWMNDSSRVFPVTVDPAIGTTDAVGLADTYVYENVPTGSYYSSVYMNVGDDANLKRYVSYWKKSTLPSLPQNAYIVSASLDFYCVAYNDLSADEDVDYKIIMLSPVTSAWPSSLTWNTRMSHGSAVSFINVKKVAVKQWYSFDITSLVRDWYDGTKTNYGVALYEQSNNNAYVQFASYEYGSTYGSGYRPCFVVNYRDLKGIEPYLSYQTHDVGYAGTGAVNYATGALTLSVGTLTGTDALMPYTLSLTYNSSLAGLEYKYSNAQTPYSGTYAPYGFKVSTNETLAKKTMTDENGASAIYYIYADADGTEHYFAAIDGQSGQYADEDGLGLVLREVSTSEITVTNTAGTVKRFVNMNHTPSSSGYSSGWRLTEIQDVSGNKTVISINNSSNQIPILIETLPNGHSTTIEQMKIELLDYKPSVIWNQASGHAVILRYSSTATGELDPEDRNYLREVVYAYGPGCTASQWQAYSKDASQSTGISVYATATYTYDENGLLTVAKDVTSGYEMRYTYTGGKVTQLTQYFGSSKGKTLGITYNEDETVTQGNLGINSYGSTSDVKTHYVFDSEGRTVSTYTTNLTGDTVYGAQSGAYSADALSKNSLEHSVVIGGDNVNYLVNGGFKNGTRAWTLTSNVTTSYQNSLSGTGTAVFAVKANTTDSITQSVFLKSGTYTLTVNYESHNAKNTTMLLKAVPSSGSTQSVEVPLNDSYASNGASEYSLTFNVSNVTNGGQYYNISVAVTGGASVSDASVTLHHLVLARGIGAEKYSISQFGSFENHAKASNGTESYTPSSLWLLGSYGAIASDDLFGNVLRITGNASSAREAIQNVWINTEYQQNDHKSFIVSAFGRADCTAKCTDSFFGIKVDVYYQSDSTDDPDIVTHEFPFCESTDEWQFVSGTFTVEPRSIQKIVVRCVFDYYLTYGYFDNISLVFDTAGDVVRNTYENGLLKKSTDGFNTTHYEYNEQKQVTRVANNRGQLTNYFYDESGYLLKKEIVCTFTYGDNGVIQYPDEVDESCLHITLKNATLYYYNEYGLLTQKRYGRAGQSSSGSIGIGGGAIATYTSYNTTPGSHIFGYVVTETNALGKVTRYSYNQTTGYLMAVANPDGKTGVCYTYDNWGKIKRVQAITCTVSGSAFTYTPIEDGESVSYTYNEKGLLTGLSTQSTDYTFAYTTQFLLSRLYVGGNKRNGYTYANQKQIYEELPNSCKLYFMYDVLGRVSKIRLLDMSGTETVSSDLYRYTYTDDGLLHRAEDVQNGQVTEYLYTTDGKLIGTHVSDSTTGTMLYGTNLEHDAQGRVRYATHGYDYVAGSNVKYGTVGYSYTYDTLDKLTGYGFTANILLDGDRTFTYDALQRVSQINSTYTGDTQTFTQTESYEYDDTGTVLSGRVKKYTTTIGNQSAKSYTYTYDANGNITKIEQSGGDQSSVEYRYVYDDQNQLIREDNGAKNQTYVYTYDNAGNMTSRNTYAITEAGTTPSSPTGTRSYTYGNEAWGDQLTAVNGYSSTYDSMGNPLTYYNGHNSYTFTWEEGKYLASAARGSNTVTYTYNENGIRTSKTVNGVKHTYTLNGSQIVSEAWDNKLVVFIYDESGSPIGMQYRESTYAPGEFDCFFYEKNLQGDIVGIFNEAGTRVVWYTYDAWGTSSPVYLTGYAWVYNANPFRYRGYYYDADTYLYYLNSRYYDHRAGRFVSADVSDVLTATPMALTDKNLYAYCDNNPVMRADGNGEFWNKISSFFYNIGSAFVTSIEAEVGIGIGFGGNLSDNVTAEISRDTYIGISDGTWETGNTITAEASLFDSPASIGTSWKHTSEKNGIRISEASSEDGPFDMINYPDTSFDNQWSFLCFSRNKNDEFLISFSASAHMGGGGHVSIGFNVSKFLERLFD